VQALSETKPLRWSFLLTFSIVLLAIWGVVLVCAHSQRARLIGELAQCIAHGTENEATAAIRQMARMPDPPLTTFVLAAASPSREVAREAQDAIGELLGRWQHQIKSGRSARQIDNRLGQLAAALDVQRDSISTLDFPWLAKTAEKILRLADATPSESLVDLTIHCETLLSVARAPARDLHLNILPVASATIDASPDTIFTPPSRLALQTILPDDAPLEIRAGNTPMSQSTTSINETSVSPVSPLRWSRPGINHSPMLPLPRRFDARGQAGLKRASPIPVVDARPANTATPNAWAVADARTLLERWLAESGVMKNEIERELERRGFGRLRSDVVRLALSDDTTGRVQLVQDLPATPGLGTTAWLILFAEDADAEVRLTAVTMMAASSDDQLLEKAWQIALHDRDPRIASLAQRLRVRRDLPQRR
jgi:hypothetical protein